MGHWMAGATFATVEHLMAALAGAGVDNCRVQLSNDEVPIMDGSAREFSSALAEKDAVVAIPDSVAQCIKVLKRVEVQAGDGRLVSLQPCSEESAAQQGQLHISVQVDFGARIQDGAGGIQSFEFEKSDFIQTVSAARTFCFYEDIQRMRSLGMALGGSLDNAVVFQDGLAINPSGLRFVDEVARHKALDVLGDLYLGGALAGEYIGLRPGHVLNQSLLRELFSSSDNFALSPILNLSEVQYQ
mmetsp:Transcript_14507/g.22526  ORF Transcript_14507/g.22526 Transcript_14507/m.22526 type:complete len:243 (+) Transcript_14507:75-803(+)